MSEMPGMSASTKRLVTWSVVAVAVIAGLVLAFAPRSVTVDMTRLAEKPMVVTLDEEGETRVHDVFVLSAPVAGRVQRIEAHVGDPVVAGETILAEIEPADPTFLDPRSEARARAAVHAAESARELARAEVEEAEAELEFAEAEVRRARELVAEETISRRDLDAAEREYKTRRAALATARAGLHMRLFELEQARAALISPAQTRAREAECDCVPITAPVSGTVLRIVNTSERVVAAGDALLEIGDPTDLEIVVDFLSADAVQVRPGQPVIIERWGGKEPLAGRVRRVEPFGFTKVSALGIEEQRVNVVIDFVGDAGSRARLGHGYQVEARVVLWERERALAVPLTSLFRDGERWAVFVDDDGRARKTHIELGRQNGLEAEIIEGLEDGDRVVMHPSDRVVDGARIAARG